MLNVCIKVEQNRFLNIIDDYWYYGYLQYFDLFYIVAALQISLDMQDQQEHFNQEPQVTVSPLEKLKAAISIAETIPPSKIRKNLIGLINLAPEIQDNLMEKIDLPLQVETSDPNGPFLKTEFNRDGDSYRSPLSNKYFPESEGYLPQGELRRIEEIGNVLFAQYTKLYYGNGAISNFFVTEGSNADTFSFGFFAKKECNEGNELGFEGNWDSFNVADVTLSGDEATIKLNSNILIEMGITSEAHGSVGLTGFLKKTKTEKRKVGKDRLEDVIVAFGEMVQDLQTVLRQYLEGIYIGKTREVVFSTRYEYTVQFQKQRRNLAKGLREVHLQG